MHIRHMAGGTTNPCSQIPSFLKVSTIEEYEATRPICEKIYVYFNETREGKTGKGRLTALGACGRAIEYHYKMFL
jgi:hypothetical protein